MDYYIYNGELYHSGRKGMKWYQNIFSKDKIGSKRRKASRTDQGEDDSSETKPKSHKDMTDDELRKETERYNLEANYLSAKSRATQSPAQSQKNDSFAKKFVNDAIKPAVIAAGKTQLEKYLNDKISKLTKGKVDPNSIEALRVEAEKLGLKSKISSSKKVIESNNDWFNERAKAKAQKEVDDYNERLRDSKNTGPKTYSRTGESISDRFTRTRESSNLPAVVNRPRGYLNSPDVVRESVQSSGLMKTNSASYRDYSDKGRSATQKMLTDRTIDLHWDPDEQIWKY